MEIDETFWNASIQDLKRGFRHNRDNYECLLCGHIIAKGIIYPHQGVLLEAKSYMRLHIKEAHTSVFDFLIGLDKKLTGLSDHQKTLLKLFYQEKTDAEIQELTGIGASSTIRNHRFNFKEKERQSKVFLTMMELLKQKDDQLDQFIGVSKTSKMVDDRYNVTLPEKQKIIEKYFPQGTGGKIKNFPPKEKIRLIIVSEIAQRFTRGTFYTEKEVNEILKPVHDDYVLIRRYLIEYGFLERKADGSRYWLK
ncbi:MAG: DUF2087 domain-containing protein [Actinomycetota bacterium]|nr:DUF2087 domain-containing protein [Actinomycetota bacterium]